MTTSPILGNDIVDWNSVKQQSQKLKPRLLEKIFNPIEIDFVNSHDDSMLAFWQLWSVKEAAYKAWQRLNNAKPSINPKSFNCIMNTDESCNVTNGSFCAKVKVNAAHSFIYSSITDKPDLISKVFSSRVSYQIFLKNLELKDWLLTKDNNGIPSLQSQSKEWCFPLSITHDEEWSAVQITKYVAELIFE